MMQLKINVGTQNENALRFGFGIEVMKMTKVCKRCARAMLADRYVCNHCGAKLPRETLFQLYQRTHRQCPICDTVLAAGMKFCPHCGVKLENEKRGEG